MKTVFSNDMLAHVWAQNNQRHGRSNNGNFYFEGPTLYSYGTHFVVGFHLPNGGPTLLNTEGYSISTNGHKSDARQAVRGRNVIYVPQLTRLVNEIQNYRDAKSPGMRAAIKAHCFELSKRGAICDESLSALLAYAGLSRSLEKLKRDSARSLANEKAAGLKKQKAQALALLKQIETDESALFRQLTESLLNRSHVTAESAIKDASGPIRQAQRVLGKAGTPKRVWQASQTALKLMAGMESRLEAGRAPAAKRARVRTLIREYRRAMRSAGANSDAYTSAPAFERADSFWQVKEALRRAQGALAAMCNHESGGIPSGLRRKALEATAILQPEIDRLTACYHEARSAESAERERLRAMSQEESRLAWFNGEPSQWRGSKDNGAAYLRATGVQRDAAGAIVAGTLETSQGAIVPLVAAIRAFRFVKLVKERGEPWHRNGQTLPVGHFQIDRIETSGNFRAGCHAIDWDQIEALAVALDVAGLAASAEGVNHGVS